MKFKFQHPLYPGYPCPWGNFMESKRECDQVGFLNCDGVPGLIQKLRLILEEKTKK